MGREASMSRVADTVPAVWRDAPLPAVEADRRGEGTTWVNSLRSSSSLEREQATARLHELLVGAARFELLRRRGAWSSSGETLDDLAAQSADSALVALLGKLDDFRAESKFTTWAFKFAILEAAMLVRRCSWRERELPSDPQTSTWMAEATRELPDEISAREQLREVTKAIQTELSPHARARRGADRRVGRTTEHNARRPLQDAA